MDDLERYGDYNEYEDDIPKSKSKVVLVLKILIAVVCVSVIGLFAFRMIMFNYYPESVKNIYFTDKLTASLKKQHSRRVVRAQNGKRGTSVLPDKIDPGIYQLLF